MTNKQEQGRSMVEMLGVLAVVGVLSAGGIAGYTYAMDRHRTNELLNEASKRAVVVASQIASGRTPSLAEFGTGETAGGKIESVMELEGEFGFKVTGVKESVCENIVKMVDESSGFIQDLTKANDVNSIFTLSDCSGDENSFIFIFNSDVGNGESGASVSRCEESEKVSVTYTGGRCCNETKTGKFCPGDEPATCVRDAGCDCSDEECCDALGGSWAVDGWEEYSICCSEGTALCPEYTGDCVCVPDGYSSACDDLMSCIACAPGEGEPKCSEEANGCVCTPEGYDWMCSNGACITCSPTEGKAMCPSEGACICIPDGYSWSCGNSDCIACPSGETAKCADYADCVCVPDGYSSLCNDEHCIACSPSEGTALCSEYGDCICVPDGYDSDCSEYECKTCPPTETLKCSQESCICVPEGYSGVCNEENCVVCPSGQPAVCDGDDGDCVCATDASQCGNEECCNTLDGSWDSVYGDGEDGICCSSGTPIAAENGRWCKQEGETSACDIDDMNCIVCSPSDGQALCAAFWDCICVPDGYSSTCNGYHCKACSPSEGTALCGEFDGPCTCVPNGYSGACSDSGDCITCASGTALCSDGGRCICVPDGYSSLCNYENCVACPSGQTPFCENDWDGCECV